MVHNVNLTWFSVELYSSAVLLVKRSVVAFIHCFVINCSDYYFLQSGNSYKQICKSK